jgi:hypothetical protein
MKKTFLVTIVLILTYVGFWMIYSYKLTLANEQWYQERYVNQEIGGKLKSITEYSNDRNKVILVIKNTIDQRELTYGTICIDKPFRDYIAIGDSVYKKQGYTHVFFCKSVSDCKQFELDFCK